MSFFTFDHWIDPVDVFHHIGVNAWFPRATAALSPADDPVQEADVTSGAGQRAPRVPLFRTHGEVQFTDINTGHTDQSGATQTAESHAHNLFKV